MDSSSDIMNVASRHSVDETVARFQSLLGSKGVKLFALIDHSGEAEKAGLHMPPTKLLIFGNPKGGTPLMLAAPSIAIDLPLKALVWEDPEVRSGFPITTRITSRRGINCRRGCPGRWAQCRRCRQKPRNNRTSSIVKSILFGVKR